MPDVPDRRQKENRSQFVQQDEPSWLAEEMQRGRAHIFQAVMAVSMDPHMTEDALQEAYLRLLPHVETLMAMPEKEREAYITTTAKRISLSLFRKTHPQIFEPLDDEHVPQESCGEEPGELVMCMLTQERVSAGLERLSARDRCLLRWKYLHHWADKEIAESLDIAEQSVRTAVRRARARLKMILMKDEWFDEE